MPANRTLIKRPRLRHAQITEEALEAFREIKRLENRCTCPPDNYPHYVEDCEVCKQWWKFHTQLHRALQLSPAFYPCIPEPKRRYDPKRPSDSPLANALYEELELAL
jgi:hypothetical protein